MSLSPYATLISSPPSNPVRTQPIVGVAIHTTGSGLPSSALASGNDPFQAGIAYYRQTKGPTYLVGWDGQIAAIFPDELIKTWHVGIESNEVGPINSGGWRQMVSPATVAAWNARWGANRNPRDLIGGALPNDVVVGIETIPVTDGSTVWYPPMRPGLRFSKPQHDALRKLVADIAARNGFPAGWQRTRLFGHEDLNPIRRYDSSGGWDPGRLRAQPFMDMNYIASSISPLAVGVAIGGAALLAFLWARSRS